jgi:hypothetical protein
VRTAEPVGPFRQVVHHRKIDEGFAAEEGERQALRAKSNDALFNPVRHARGRLQRHLVGVLVVVAVIALKAVVAGEIALQRRQHSDPHLLGVFAVVGEEFVERPVVRVAIRHEKSVLRQRG